MQLILFSTWRLQTVCTSGRQHNHGGTDLVAVHMSSPSCMHCYGGRGAASVHGHESALHLGYNFSVASAVAIADRTSVREHGGTAVCA